LVLSLFASGCASVVHGKTQSIQFSSSPPGATVTANGQRGTTPCEIEVPRRSPDQDYAVATLDERKPPVFLFELPGYDPIDVRLTYGTSGWATWGNALGGGLILGLPAGAYDASTGAALSIDHHGDTVDRIDVDFVTKRVTIE
jgi:hypothetical protein